MYLETINGKDSTTLLRYLLLYILHLYLFFCLSCLLQQGSFLLAVQTICLLGIDKCLFLFVHLVSFRKQSIIFHSNRKVRTPIISQQDYVLLFPSNPSDIKRQLLGEQHCFHIFNKLDKNPKFLWFAAIKPEYPRNTILGSFWDGESIFFAQWELRILSQCINVLTVLLQF